MCSVAEHDGWGKTEENAGLLGSRTRQPGLGVRWVPGGGCKGLPGW
jgi:hypothetical protein